MVNKNRKGGSTDIARAYDAAASSYAELLPTAGSQSGPESSLELTMVRTFAESPSPGWRILDAGCGPGRTITYLETLAPLAIEGRDISPGMVRAAWAAHPQRRIAVAELAGLPYSHELFDGILAWYSLIHTPPAEIPQVFAEMRRIRKPAGKILLGFHAGMGTRRIAHPYGHPMDLTVYLHDVDVLSAHLEDAGFRLGARNTRAPRSHEQEIQGFISAQFVGWIRSFGLAPEGDREPSGRKPAWQTALPAD